MQKTTIYIVPALTDMAGQCRIVQADGKISNARDSYRTEPAKWREIGLMNSRGSLVCISAESHIAQELKDCEPLMAGVTFVM